MAISNFDIKKLKRLFTTAAGSASGVANTIVNWLNISGRPTLFPPEDHTHLLEDITDVEYYQDVKHNLNSTSNPNHTNDETEDYSIGSVWINNSAQQVYVCTNNSTGAAVWGQTNSTIVDDAPSDGSTYGRRNGSWALCTGGGGDIPVFIILNGLRDIVSMNFTTNEMVII